MSDPPKPPPLPPSQSLQFRLRSGRLALAWAATVFGTILVVGGLIGCGAAWADSGYWHIRPVERHPLLSDGLACWDILPPPTPEAICILIVGLGFHLVIVAQILLVLSRRDSAGETPPTANKSALR